MTKYYYFPYLLILCYFQVSLALGFNSNGQGLMATSFVKPGQALVLASWKAGEQFHLCSDTNVQPLTDTDGLQLFQTGSGTWTAYGQIAGQTAFLLTSPQLPGCLGRTAVDGKKYPPIDLSAGQPTGSVQLPDEQTSMPLLVVYYDQKKRNKSHSGMINPVMFPLHPAEGADREEVSGSGGGGLDFPDFKPKKPGFYAMGKASEMIIDISFFAGGGKQTGLSIAVNDQVTHLSDQDIAWLYQHLWEPDFEQLLAEYAAPDFWPGSWLSDDANIRLMAMKAVWQELMRTEQLKQQILAMLPGIYQYPVTDSKTVSSASASSGDKKGSSTGATPSAPGAKAKPVATQGTGDRGYPQGIISQHDHSRCCPHPDCKHSQCVCTDCSNLSSPKEPFQTTVLERSYAVQIYQSILQNNLESFKAIENSFTPQSMGRARFNIKISQEVLYTSASALYLAVREGAEKIVAHLLEQGFSNVNEQAQCPTGVNNRTPLMMAATKVRYRIASMLLKAGADINLRDAEGNNADLLAIERVGVEGRAQNKDAIQFVRTLLAHRKNHNLSDRGVVQQKKSGSFITVMGYLPSEKILNPDELEKQYNDFIGNSEPRHESPGFPTKYKAPDLGSE